MGYSALIWLDIQWISATAGFFIYIFHSIQLLTHFLLLINAKIGWLNNADDVHLFDSHWLGQLANCTTTQRKKTNTMSLAPLASQPLTITRHTSDRIYGKQNIYFSGEPSISEDSPFKRCYIKECQKCIHDSNIYVLNEIVILMILLRYPGQGFWPNVGQGLEFFPRKLN